MPPDAHRPLAISQKTDRGRERERGGEKETVGPTLMVRDDDQRTAGGQLADAADPEERGEESANEEPSDPR